MCIRDRRKPGQTRIDLAQTNVNIIKQIAPQIVKSCPDATYVIVSNPVDILTYVFHKVTNIPENRIIGTGKMCIRDRSWNAGWRWMGVTPTRTAGRG